MDYMEHNIIFGNGINIEFGGFDNYSNKAIMSRLMENIKSDKYKNIFKGISNRELLESIDGLFNIVKDISKWANYADGLFMLMEIERIKNLYDENSKIEDIGLEDIFIAVELLSNKYKDDERFRHKINRELQMLMLDAIYNDGNINTVDYTNEMQQFLLKYSHVFTINYDTNLDRYYDGVMHLHGRFDSLAPEYDANSLFVQENPNENFSRDVIVGYEYMFSNTIMSWYWLEKYGHWIDSEKTFGADSFKNMSGHLDIVGMSPCNDEHLFLMINQSQLKNVTYYYRSENDRASMSKKIQKPITYTHVDKFWSKIK